MYINEYGFANGGSLSIPNSLETAFENVIEKDETRPLKITILLQTKEEVENFKKFIKSLDKSIKV